MPSIFEPGCFTAPKFPYVKTEKCYVARKIVMKTIITGYEDKECTKPIGSMVPSVVEEKIPIKQLVQSHANEVGVANIIRRILQTGDMSLLNQREAQYVDTTKLPKSIGQVQEKAIALESIYASIPADLKKDMTLEQFVTTMTNEKIKAYYDKQLKVVTANKKEEGAE